ncbi:MAG: UDP-4-amino-4-deoxy-L-arabinose--oxoglutarate aminotransferase [Candidatus Argoarchaeum ethanivorans]|uniref:UDP-4-amino-4-deoxy-L-arabinose--oxoglutarate aminotransferase n=1 Tax=Candidatus Argoarchaeum ethanivorans TaxID=2608793 RepID=A0A812A1F2_9EURY|nr:MAG: UDP-4-amino-4-deoxy-L-arabinose--oxoglutarate aminotransferase [Candidatus Argoarchaeum ethanivorans]
MQVPFLDLKTQYKELEKEVVPAVTTAMENGAFIGGPQVTGFEEEFAEFCDSKQCVGVNSGTDALRFALMAVGVQPGDEVITVPNTFIATTESISQVGARPVFVDISPDTCNMDPSGVEKAITEKTKAIIPVHLYGQTVDMDPLMESARKNGLAVIEDACQAHGALYKNRKAGSIGSVGCFSFYPGKNLGAYGEGGAAVTHDESIARKMSMIRDHGQSKKYYHDIEGYNGRLDAIQAGILRIKLKRLAGWNQSRRENAKYYDGLLSDLPDVTLVKEAEFAQSVYHLYVILVEDRDGLQKFLDSKGIATGLHYPLPLHLQKAYDHLGYSKGDFPVTEKIADRLLSLPMFPELTKDQIEYVVDAIKEFLL